MLKSAIEINSVANEGDRGPPKRKENEAQPSSNKSIAGIVSRRPPKNPDKKANGEVAMAAATKEAAIIEAT